MVDASVKNFRVSFTTIFLFDFFLLFTIAKDAPLRKASLINKLPLLFLPLIAKKILFFLISLELIDAFLNFNFEEILFELLSSFKIFSLKLFESVLFLILIFFNICSFKKIIF